MGIRKKELERTKDGATTERRRGENKKAAQSGGLRLEKLEMKCARQQRATGPTGGSEVWEWTISVIVWWRLAVKVSRSRGELREESRKADASQQFPSAVLLLPFQLNPSG